MSSPPLEPKWPRLLSLSVHEFRTPISVVAGYLRMVLKDPAGTLDERHRRMLEEAEKSCGRLSALVAEMSDLSALEAGTAAFKKAPVDIRSYLDRRDRCTAASAGSKRDGGIERGWRTCGCTGRRASAAVGPDLRSSRPSP